MSPAIFCEKKPFFKFWALTFEELWEKLFDHLPCVCAPYVLAAPHTFILPNLAQGWKKIHWEVNGARIKPRESRQPKCSLHIFGECGSVTQSAHTWALWRKKTTDRVLQWVPFTNGTCAQMLWSTVSSVTMIPSTWLLFCDRFPKSPSEG